MSLMNIIGPVMIGPSSSHTAGAVRIGMLARRLWGWDRPLPRAEIYLRGSFAATYWGHGTDRGLVAGLLRMKPDDLRIPDAFHVAQEEGLEYSFDTEEVDGAHPNSVRIVMHAGTEKMEVIGASVGGGAVELHGLDGFEVRVPCDSSSIISFHLDVPGVVASISNVIYECGLNLGEMRLDRRGRGDIAIGVFCVDGSLPAHLPYKIMSATPACRKLVLLDSLYSEE